MKVLVCEPYSAESLARLQAEGFHILTGRSEAATAQVALIRSRTRVDQDFLAQHPELKFVVTATSGFDHIDWRQCIKNGVTVAHTPNANAISTAELTWGLLLALERQIIQAHKAVRGNAWREALARPKGLFGRSFGIIGLGRVGQRVAKMADTFGLSVLAHDPYVAPEVFHEAGCERLSLTELLRSADIVSLHVPLTKETKHMLNQPTFQEMNEDAILLNTCRGPVVDENDLLLALDEGWIAGAAVDVIEREPPPAGHKVRLHPKLLMTPHIGAHTEQAWAQASMEACEKVLQFRAGSNVPDTLPLSLPWSDKT